MIDNRLKGGLGILIMRPNQSGTLTHNCIVVALALGCALLANLPLLLIGIWLPGLFALIFLVWLVIGLCINLVSLDFQQVIYLKRSWVVVEQGRKRPQQRWKKPRAWMRLEVTDLHHLIRLPRVALVYGGEHFRLGSFLNKSELKRLVRILNKQLNAN